MQQVSGKTEDPRLEALHRRMAENSLGGHWQSRDKPRTLQPYLWPWSVIYSCLMESGEVVKLGTSMTPRSDAPSSSSIPRLPRRKPPAVPCKCRFNWCSRANERNATATRLPPYVS